MNKPPSNTEKKPGNGKGRRAAVATAAALVTLGLLSTAYWHWAAGRVVEGLDNWRQQQRARGILVSYGELEVSGYPFSIDLALSAPAIAAPDGRYWEGPAIVGQAALWNPFSIDADISGEHRVGGLDGDGIEEIVGLVGRASLRVELAFDGIVTRAETAMSDLRVLHRNEQLLTVEQLDAVLGPLRPAEAERLQELDIDGSARRITLRGNPDFLLGNQVESLALKATLRGPLPAQEARHALPIWRDAGGEAIVHGAEIAWGPLQLHLKGGATLDAQLRPEGQFGTRISGLSEVLDALLARGAIEPGQAGLMNLALITLGGGDARRLALPITMKDGLLSAGPVPIAPIRPLL